MVIIAVTYLVLLWLLFAKFKLIRLTWSTGTVAALLGGCILAVFLALLNYLTPTGHIVVGSRVVEVTPNVSGEVIAIPVKTNVPVKAGSVLFEIDPTPFKYKVAQLQAALVSAQHQAEVLKANYEQATANVAGLEKQVAFHEKRLDDIGTLTRAGATTPFREQDTREQLDIAVAQLQAAKAAQISARAALDSTVGGINTSVLQTRAQLDDARWELEQTTIKAPSDGYVSTMALAVGARALQARAAMSFIVASDLTIVGTFSQNGFHTIKPGAQVGLVFDNDPGRIHDASLPFRKASERARSRCRVRWHASPLCVAPARIRQKSRSPRAPTGPCCVSARQEPRRCSPRMPAQSVLSPASCSGCGPTPRICEISGCAQQHARRK